MRRYLRWTSVLSRRVSIAVARSREAEFKHWPYKSSRLPKSDCLGDDSTLHSIQHANHITLLIYKCLYCHCFESLCFRYVRSDGDCDRRRSREQRLSYVLTKTGADERQYGPVLNRQQHWSDTDNTEQRARPGNSARIHRHRQGQRSGIPLSIM